ncbi:MAG TPA: serine hydrolase domain-containing protein [Pyrinomonadaceae bacterium]|nr:serine hydrolase domain-containing protein [Pyrinomonadaceae bacterium]
MRNKKMKTPDLFIRKIIALILFMVGLTAADILGQQNATAQTQPSDNEAAKKVDAFLSQWDKNDMPGCAVGAVKDGRLVYKRAFGMANLDYDVPNTTSTLFNLASSSKPFTAASIALLAQQGKLSLDDDIRKYLPEMPKYDETITIRHLIHHSSGIREYQALLLFGGQTPDNALSDKTILNLLARQKNISFKPGTKHQYSNSNYHLLGIIVGRVSGKSLRAFAEENIFKPLGMKNTLFFDNRNEVVKNRASGYMVGPDKSVRVRASLFDLVGGGGVLTTVEDLYLWDQNFHEPKIGNKELIGLLTTPGVLNSGEKMGYAFGLFHNKYKGLPVIKHSGNMSGYRSQIVSFPEQKFTAIALCNNSAIFPSVIAEKLADIYLEGQLKPDAPSQKTVAETLPPAIALPEKEALRYAGIYANPETGKVFKLGVKDGKLINSGLLQYEIPVMPVSENRLLIVEGANVTELNPVFSASGTISEIKILTKSGKPDVFVPVKPPLDSPEALSEYAGTYYSDELDADFKLTLQGNNLSLQIGENLKPTLAAAYADVFTAAGGQINLSFTRDDKGKIAGFVFNSAADGREVKGITFKRQ